MNSSVFSYVTQQLLYQAPVFLVALVGLVVSLLFLNRSRWPSLLTLSSMLILLLSTVVFTVIEAYVLSAQIGGTFSADNYRHFLSGMNLLASVVEGLAVCLLLVAVFLGRKRKPTPEKLS